MAEKLIRGSQEIDRMKGETELVVRMVLGMARDSKKLCKGFFNNVGYHDSLSSWEISVRPDGKLHARCLENYFEVGEGRQIAYTTDPTWMDDHPSMGLEGVRFAHKGLNDFLVDIHHVFPELKVRWQPFIDAAA